MKLLFKEQPSATLFFSHKNVPDSMQFNMENGETRVLMITNLTSAIQSDRGFCKNVEHVLIKVIKAIV